METNNNYSTNIKMAHKDKETDFNQGTLQITRRKSLRVRSLFDYDPKVDGGVPSRGLAFAFGDVLHVTNASDDHWWRAYRVSPDGARISKDGVIPSMKRWTHKQQIKSRTINFNNNDEIKYIEKTNTRKRRSSIFPQKDTIINKIKKAFSNEDVSYTNYLLRNMNYKHEQRKMKVEATKILTYEPVRNVELTYKRPVLLLGLIKDRIMDDLIAESKDEFEIPVPHTCRLRRKEEIDGKDYHFVNSRLEMEEDINNNKYIEAGEHDGNLYGTSISSVRDIAYNLQKHCLLNVSANAIRRLHREELYPVTIFIKPNSVDQILEWNKRMTEKEAWDVYSDICKIETDFKEYFTVIVSADTPEEVYLVVKDQIKSHSEGSSWIPVSDV